MTIDHSGHLDVHDAINGSFLMDRATVMEPLQLLSLDGGGLYGLTQACWLRELAERNPQFMVRPTWDSDLGKRQLDKFKKLFKRHHRGRELCDEDIRLYKEFNTPHDPHHPSMLMFAGCSAGGVNALLMAQFENPREAIIAKDEFGGQSMLEAFWKESGLYTNSKDPYDRFWSFLMVTPWLGTKDCLDLLTEDRFFGNRRMKDLRHPVLISIYNWYDCSKTPDFPPIIEKPELTEPYRVPDSEPSNPMADMMSKMMPKWAQPRDLSQYRVPALMQWAQANQFMRDRPIDSLDRTWGPDWLRFFGPTLRHDWVNGILAAEVEKGWSRENTERVLFAKEVLRWFNTQKIVRDDDNVLLADAGFASMSMPPARGVRGGAGDGAVCNPNPSIDLLVAALRIRSVRTYAYVKFQHIHDGGEKTERKVVSALKKAKVSKELVDHPFDDRVERMAQRLAEQPLGVRLLSLGAGETQPAYAIKDFNFGPLPFMTVPVGFAWGKQTPNSFSYNQAMQDVDANLGTLLATDPEPDTPFSSAYFRINPDINKIPPGPVLKYVRNDALRKILIDQVVEASKSSLSLDRINKATDWMKVIGQWEPGSDESLPEYRWDALHSQAFGAYLGDILGTENTTHLMDVVHGIGNDAPDMVAQLIKTLTELDPKKLDGMLEMLKNQLGVTDA